jgi:uncharacterized protein YkwD
MKCARWGGTTVAALATLAGVVGLLLLSASPITATADGASACKRWGKARATSLSTNRARKAVACLVNRKRDQHGLGNLDRNHRLHKAAQRHTKRMRQQRCFSHQCPGEADLSGRLRSVRYLKPGLSRWACGENIAWGLNANARPVQVVRAWMNSPPHRSAILSRTFRDIGVGYIKGTPAYSHGYGATYTIDFGLRQH